MPTTRRNGQGRRSGSPPTQTFALIKVIENILCERPAGTQQEIADRVNAKLGFDGESAFKPGDIAAVLHYWRKHSEDIGSTVHYVKGKHSETRYFLILKDRDGSTYFDPGRRSDFNEGQLTNLQRVGTYMANAADMADAAVTYMPTPALRLRVEELKGDILYVASKAKALIERLEAQIAEAA